MQLILLYHFIGLVFFYITEFMIYKSLKLSNVIVIYR
jgi:hypothetical protein